VQMWRIVNGSGRSGVFINGAKSFVDASNAPAGFRYRRIAQDGVQLDDVNYQHGEDKPLLLASGNRADLLVMAPKTPGTYQMMVQHEVDPSDLSSAIPVVLLQIRVNNNLPPVTGHRLEFIPAMPKLPVFLTNITAQEANTPRTAPPRCIPVDRASASPCGTANNPRLVVFSTEPPVGPTPPPTPSPGSQHLIDGQQFNENPDDAKTVTLDTVEEWQVENTSIDPNIGPVAHPFHIHVNPFQLVEIFDPNQTVVVNGRTVPKYVTTTPDDASVQCQINPTDRRTWVDCHNGLADDKVPRIWWDVFPIPSANQSITVKVAGYFGPLPGHFRMRSRFVDFPGEYVIHCHILAHEDRGMMALVELKAPSAPSMLGMYHHH
jgi:FtsP/CotA-like multicopper oxidase with cupredoxin domain